MPVFKTFIEKAINKENARPFKVSEGIEMMVIDAKTGKKANYGSTDTLIEAFKAENLQKNYFEDDQFLNYKIKDKNIFNFY